MPRIKLFRFVVFLVLVSFTLHFVWESLHIRLYTGYESLSPVIPITLFATIGDVLYTLAVVVVFSLVHRGFGWLSRIRLTEGTFLAVVGFALAVFVEYKGLMFHRWSYLPSMPIIPFLNVGASPVLQMTILLPLSLFLAYKLLDRTNKDR